MSNKLSSRFSNKNIVENKPKNEEVKIKAVKEVINKNETFDILNTVKEDFKKSLEQKILAIPVWFEYSNEQREELIKSFVSNKIKEDNLLIPDNNKNELIKNLICSFSLFGTVQNFLDNKKVESVTINGTKSIYISIDNQILNTETNLTESQLKYIANALKKAGKIKEFNGINKFKIDKYLVTVISDHITKSVINIKIDKIFDLNKDYLINNKVLAENIFDYVLTLIKQKKNIVISGDRNTFKTKFLEILLPDLANKRVYLIERNPQIKTDFNTLSKFQASNEDLNFNDLLSEIHSQKPEYLVTDLNVINSDLLQRSGSILTVKARTAENALKTIIGSYMKDDLPEKFSKERALEEIDYIIHFEKIDSDKIVLSKILELRPEKNVHDAIKSVVKLANGKYVTDFSRTQTRLRAK